MELLKGGGFFLKRGGGQKSCNKNLVKMLTVGIALQHITINCDIYIIWNSQPVNFLLCQEEGDRMGVKRGNFYNGESPHFPNYD